MLSWNDWRFVAPTKPEQYWLYILLPLILMIFYLSISHGMQWDEQIQQLFFNSQDGEWFIDKQNKWLRALFYYGFKYTIMAFGILLVLVVFYSFATRSSKESSIDYDALLFVIVSLAIIPSITAGLKYLTGIACPYQLQPYGGVIEYRPGLHFVWPNGLSRPRCFPAGHPSGGFALLALVPVVKYKKIMLGFVLLIGAIMSFYQIARGAHFVSHCVVTFCLAISLLAIIHYCIHSIRLKKK